MTNTIEDGAFGLWADHKELGSVDNYITQLRKGRFEDFKKCAREKEIIKKMHQLNTNNFLTDEIMAQTRKRNKNSNKQS